MSATVVVGGGGGNISTTGSATLPVTITLPTSGHLLVLGSSAFSNISSISGGGVTFWTKIQFNSGDTNHNDNDCWFGFVDTTPSTSVTVTYSASSSLRSAIVIEVAGAQKATDVDVASGNDAQGSTDSKTITTLTAGCVIFSYLGSHQASGTATATAPTGYTALTSRVSTSNGLFAAYLNQSSAGLSTMNWSGMSSTAWPSMGAIAIKAASGGPVANTLTASPGAMAITGSPSTLPIARKVSASPGSLTVTGTAATLPTGRRLAAAHGSLAVTGSAATFPVARKLVASTGAISVTGKAALLQVKRFLAASPAVFTITGDPATLVFSGGTTVYTLTASPGAYTITGDQITTRLAKALAALPGHILVVGDPATLVASNQPQPVPTVGGDDWASAYMLSAAMQQQKAAALPRLQRELVLLGDEDAALVLDDIWAMLALLADDV